MTSYKSNIQKLDTPWRRTVLPPKETLLALGLNQDGNLADIGCGVGYFTLPAAEIIGKDNTVYAIDPAPEMLEETRRRVAESGIRNVRPILSEPTDFKIEQESVLFALLANVFHEIPEKGPFIQQVWNVLQPGGKLMLIEWNGEMREFGPPENHRLSETECDRLLTSGGFAVQQSIEIGGMFYGKVYIKQC
jgi:ubiquinone/menaquinone biosynthesis C-methylase UbiE